MRQTVVFIVFFCLLYSCKKSDKTAAANDREAVPFTVGTLPKSIALNEGAATIVNSWPEFKEFENSYAILLRANTSEELLLAVEDLLLQQKKLVEATYPETFDNAQFKSRQQVVHTYLLKVKAAIDDRTDIEAPVEELATAYNALRLQCNRIVNNNFDANLILDETP